MTIYSKPKYGPQGLANVRIDAEKAKVTFIESGNTFEIFLEDAPENIIEGKYIVSLDSDKTRITNVSAPKGSYFAKFLEFSHKKDEPPMYREIPFKSGVSRKTGKPWQIKRHLEFTAIFEIQGSDFEGFRVPYNMWYCFAPFDGDPDEAMLEGSGRNKVESFLEAVGFDLMEDSIEYSENVLPKLEQTVLSKDREVALTINERGYIDEVMEAPQK